MESSKPAFEPTGLNSPPAYEANPFEVIRSRAIARLLPRGRGGLALDAGAGPGYFSRMLSERGWRVAAIDLEPENLARARRFAVEAHLGDVRDVLPALPEAAYGLACAFEIIEHMDRDDGAALVAQLRRVLAPGAPLLISTPNRYSPEGLGDHYWGEKVRGWGRWDAWNPTHVHIYSSVELRRLLTRSGFAIDRVVGCWYRGTLPGGIPWSLPLATSTRFPLNHLGFDVIVACHRAG